jgi:hypothetical protein
MLYEIIVVMIVLYLLFSDWIDAKAEMLRELARAKRLENDKIEYGDDHEG